MTHAPVPIVLPADDPMGQRHEPRRKVRGARASDILALFGAVASAVSTTVLLFAVTSLTGTLGFLVTGYVLFLVFYALLVSFDEDLTTVRDRFVAVVVHSIACLLFAALVVVVGFTLWRGRAALSHSNFYRTDLVTTGPLEGLDKGGVLQGVVGTLEQISIALVLTVPTGIAAAVYISQFRGALSRTVRTITEAATALPSIVAGLFIYAFFIIALGRPQSGIAAAMALSVMMLPIIIRAADVVLRLVPGTLLEASYALGASQWRTVWHVILPTARSGLATAVILGTARGVGETSPVLITAGYTTLLNANPLEGSQVSLPLLIFKLSRDSAKTMVSRGFGAAAILLLTVLVLFVIARFIGGRGPGQLSRRQRARARRASASDASRFAQLALARAHGVEVRPDALSLFKPEDPSRSTS